MNYFLRKNIEMPNAQSALSGREEPISINPIHFVNGHSMIDQYPTGSRQIVLGMGCFWGAERAFWQLEGVHVTSVGYAGGFTRNPTYDEVCSGMTGHTEVVHVVYQPEIISLVRILNTFWERHDPTQGMRQGNDLGTQYRSAIYYLAETEAKLMDDLTEIRESKQRYQEKLDKSGFGPITTEIKPLDAYYFAETYHQQYLAKNPNGYCGLGGTGVTCA